MCNNNWGTCPVHLKEYESEISECNTCNGEGLVEREDPCTGEVIFRNCYSCQGSGEGEYPVCQQCDEDFENELKDEISEAV